MDEARYALSDEEKITQTKWLINSLSPGENPLKIPKKEREPSYLDWAYNAIQPAINVVSYLGTLAGVYTTPDPEAQQEEQLVTLYETEMLEAIKESKLERHCHAKDARPIFELPKQKSELNTQLEAVPEAKVQSVFDKFLKKNRSTLIKLDKKYQAKNLSELNKTPKSKKEEGTRSAKEQRQIGRSTQGGPTEKSQTPSARRARR